MDLFKKFFTATVLAMALAAMPMVASTVYAQGDEPVEESDVSLTDDDTSADDLGDGTTGPQVYQTPKKKKSFLQKLMFWKRDKKRSRSAETQQTDADLRRAAAAERRRLANMNQEDLNYEFLQAAKKEQLGMMRNLLLEGAMINAPNRQGRTALIEAARTGKLDVVKILIDFGASVNAIDMYDGTALLYASKEGHYEIVNLLLENGAKKD